MKKIIIIIITILFISCSAENGEIYIKAPHAEDNKNIEQTDFSKNSEIPILRIVTIFGSTNGREIVQAFHSEATDCFERGLDAKSLVNLPNEIYFVVGGTQECDDKEEKCVISTSNLITGKIIKIAFETEEPITAHLFVTQQEFLNYFIYLYDKETNTLYPMSLTESPIINLPEGLSYDRFYIIIKGEKENI